MFNSYVKLPEGKLWLNISGNIAKTRGANRFFAAASVAGGSHGTGGFRFIPSMCRAPKVKFYHKAWEWNEPRQAILTRWHLRLRCNPLVDFITWPKPGHPWCAVTADRITPQGRCRSARLFERCCLPYLQRVCSLPVWHRVCWWRYTELHTQESGTQCANVLRVSTTLPQGITLFQHSCWGSSWGWRLSFTAPMMSRGNHPRMA